MIEKTSIDEIFKDLNDGIGGRFVGQPGDSSLISKIERSLQEFPILDFPDSPSGQKHLQNYQEILELVKEGKYEEALQKVERLENVSLEGVALESKDQLRVMIHYQAGNLREAIDILSTIRHISAKDFLLHLYLEKLLGEKVPMRPYKFEPMIAIFEKMNDKDWKGAIEEIEKLPCYLSSARNELLIACYTASGQTEKAEALIRDLPGINYREMSQDLLDLLSSSSREKSPLDLFTKWYFDQLS